MNLLLQGVCFLDILKYGTCLLSTNMGLYNMELYHLVGHECCSMAISSDLKHSLPEGMGWLKKFTRNLQSATGSYSPLEAVFEVMEQETTGALLS